MKRLVSILTLFMLVILSHQVFAFNKIVGNLKCEMLTNPIGIDVVRPRLSWQLNSEKRGTVQISYQIIVASSADQLAKNEGDLWNSGKETSDGSILVSYSGKPLTSRQKCFWKV